MVCHDLAQTVARLNQFRLSVVEALRSISAEILESVLALTVSKRTTAAKAKQWVVVSRWRFDADDLIFGLAVWTSKFGRAL